ncbi:MAG: hypothetical protein QOJ54_488, partial [Aliidongia sp.]|nr:hypothetical protein [Aliidongia sp.]
MGVRNNWIGMALLLAFASGSATAADANPEDGKLVDGVYSNPYFGLTFPLPEGYGPGLEPAKPAINGFYVLSTPRHKDGVYELDMKPHPGAHAPVMVISAQDMFFSGPSMRTALEVVTDLTHSTATGSEPKVDEPP